MKQPVNLIMTIINKRYFDNGRISGNDRDELERLSNNLLDNLCNIYEQLGFILKNPFAKFILRVETIE